MTATSDEIIAERRVRSAELALEAARRRLVEADHELGTLRERVHGLEARLIEQAERHAAEPVWLRAELASEARVRRLMEQALEAERSLRAELLDELRRRDEPGGARAGQQLERELGAAQRRARELEGELEIVRRHAAEFEHSVRLAVREAWDWLGEIGERFTAALTELEELRGSAGAPESPPAGAPESPAGAPESPAGAPESPAGARGELVAERFDQALTRLRASVPEAGAER